MGKNKIFDNDFDPYDKLIEVTLRLRALEEVHNQLAHDYLETQKQLVMAMKSIEILQQGFLNLVKFEEVENCFKRR